MLAWTLMILITVLMIISWISSHDDIVNFINGGTCLQGNAYINDVNPYVQWINTCTNDTILLLNYWMLLELNL